MVQEYSTLAGLVLRLPEFQDTKQVNPNAIHRQSIGGTYTHAPGLFVNKLYKMEFVVPVCPDGDYASKETIETTLINTAGTKVGFSLVMSGVTSAYNVVVISNDIQFIALNGRWSFQIDIQVVP